MTLTGALETKIMAVAELMADGYSQEHLQDLDVSFGFLFTDDNRPDTITGFSFRVTNRETSVEVIGEGDTVEAVVDDVLAQL